MYSIRSFDSNEIGKLIEDLAKDPISYRHVYGTLDTEYQHFGSGRPGYELFAVMDLPLLMWTESRVCSIWEKPDNDDIIDSLRALLADRRANELFVLGDECFTFFRPHLIDGQWRYSRNYGVDASTFKPKPLPSIRKLSEKDRTVVELAVENGAFGTSASTLRDFNLMADGMLVICYGAFAGDEIVGFCSANPICRGIQEISWIVVANDHRRKGFASALLTMQATEAFADGKALGYHAGAAGDDLHAMLMRLGFHEVKPSYRFIPATAEDQWRTHWGKIV